MADNKHFLIAGAGIAGLAAALALARLGQRVTLLEQATQLGEVGAGVQLGPNAMRVLAHWGLADAVLAKACVPEAIAVRHATTGRSISRMLLGAAIAQRDAAPYVTLHRADLHAALLGAVRASGLVDLQLGQGVQALHWSADAVHTTTTTGEVWQGDALLGADGLWSRVRPLLCADGAPRHTGHVALRAMVSADAAPEAIRRSEVGVWWGKQVHVVHYPVSGGQWFNVVVLAAGMDKRPAAQGWALNAEVQASQIVATMQNATCLDLQSILYAAQASGFKLWHLLDRPAAPFRLAQSPSEAGGAADPQRPLATLLGDAAHPMLPYLAQGAAMALEDAAVLGACLEAQGDVRTAFTRYELLRSARTSRVVRTAQRNGRIFHLGWPWSMARDAVLALQGTQTVGLRWLYGFNATDL